MSATFVVVPQWQGSGSSRAMRLVDGAEAIRGDLPTSATRVVDVPLEAGDNQGTPVARLSTVLLVRDRLREILEQTPGPAITIGGDCGVELAAIDHACTDDVALVWFDAHLDLNTPESSASGAFAGMVLRTLLGDAPPALLPRTALRPGQLVLAGIRACDDAEDAYIQANAVATIAVDDVAPAALITAIQATGATSVYIHVDLDVLDPADMTGIDDPQPFGVAATALAETIRAVVARFPLAGAGITQFAPSSSMAAVEDMPTILRIVGALTSAP